MQARLCECLERAQADGVELPPELVHPRAVAVGQEGLEVDRERLACVGRGGRPVVLVDRRLGAAGCGGCLLDVDLERAGRDEPQL